MHQGESILKKKRCRQWGNCQQMDWKKHPRHVEAFYHPCKFNLTCRNLGKPLHRQRFVHDCKFGASCRDQTPSHKGEFMHPKSQSMPPGQKTPQTATNESIMNKGPCPQGGLCTMMNFHKHPQHGSQFFHPCKAAEKCTLLKDRLHRQRFVHPCGITNCSNSSPQHQREYIHKQARIQRGGASTTNANVMTAKTTLENIMNKSPCKFGGQCQNMTVQSHYVNFFHPCKYGAACRIMANNEHRQRFVHPCTMARCSNMGAVHRREYYHVPMTQNQPQTPVVPPVARRQRCKDWEKCQKTTDGNHLTQFSHPCRYGIGCHNLGIQAHRERFMHPCRNQNCQNKTPLHLSQYTHDGASSSSGSINGKGQKWLVTPFREWTKPSPPPGNLFSHFKIVNIDKSTAEYKGVFDYFFEPLMKKKFPNLKTVTVKRIENYKLLLIYQQRKYVFETRKGSKGACERRLWHGTGKKLMEIITKTNFDHRMAKTKGKFGLGAYFSRNSVYSKSFAEANGNHSVFLVRVLVGDSIAMKQDKSLVRPPQKPKSLELFDSVRTGDWNEVVIYDNAQVYPEYIVSWK